MNGAWQIDKGLERRGAFEGRSGLLTQGFGSGSVEW